MRKTGEHLVEPGGIDAVSPTVGDIHTVSNALADALRSASTSTARTSAR